MASAIGATLSFFTFISIPLGAGAGSAEIAACGSSIGKWVEAISLSSACA